MTDINRQIEIAQRRAINARNRRDRFRFGSQGANEAQAEVRQADAALRALLRRRAAATRNAKLDTSF